MEEKNSGMFKDEHKKPMTLIVRTPFSLGNIPKDNSVAEQGQSEKSQSMRRKTLNENTIKKHLNTSRKRRCQTNHRPSLISINKKAEQSGGSYAPMAAMISNVSVIESRRQPRPSTANKREEEKACGKSKK